jgi:hypothetical protein
VRWSKNCRKAMSSTSSSSMAASDCSEPADNGVGSYAPTLGLHIHLSNGTSEDHIFGADQQSNEEAYNSLLTPKPQANYESYDNNSFPFGVSRPVSKLDSSELAMHLRDDKLLDVAGANIVDRSLPFMSPSPLNEGDSLTEENVGKLERQGPQGSA